MSHQPSSSTRSLCCFKGTAPPSSRTQARARCAAELHRHGAHHATMHATALARVTVLIVSVHLFSAPGAPCLVKSRMCTCAVCPFVPSQSNAHGGSLTPAGCAVQTLAYLLPMLARAVQHLEDCIARREHHEEAGPDLLVIAPSRELCMQIVRVSRALLPAEARCLVGPAIGGVNMKRQEEYLRRNNPIVIVGTAGRLADYSKRGVLRTHRTRMLVLDEVDQLLCAQFQPDMLRIAKHFGRKLQQPPQVVRACAGVCRQCVLALRMQPGVTVSVLLW